MQRYRREVAFYPVLWSCYRTLLCWFADFAGRATLQRRLWRQLVVTAIAFGTRCTEAKAYVQALDLLLKADKLAVRPGACFAETLMKSCVVAVGQWRRKGFDQLSTTEVD